MAKKRASRSRASKVARWAAAHPEKIASGGAADVPGSDATEVTLQVPGEPPVKTTVGGLQRAADAIRERQGELPGMETPKHEEIIRAAERLESARADAKAATQEVSDAQEALVEAMREKDLAVYIYDGLHVEITESVRAKVERVGAGSGEPAED